MLTSSTRYCLRLVCGNMVFSYGRRSRYMHSPPHCEIGPKWIVLYDGEECPLSEIEFDSESEVKCVVRWLNRFKLKRRFELKVLLHDGLHNCFQIWDNLTNKPVEFAPLHLKTTDPTATYQAYVKFLNELYEETPIDE